ncbi:MAG: sugar ABC transporter permease [Spirochaetales bacterium]|nr:sugar ABC transporter permease [Spirochaetales bacterium]
MKKHDKNGFIHEMTKNKILYLMFIPIFLYYLLLAYIPMTGIVMAFKEFNYRDGLWMSPWIGLKNFEFFFKSGKALQVTVNTAIYNGLFLVCYTFFSILVAVLVADMRGKYYRKITQSFMFLPYFISWVVISSMLNNFFHFDHGIFNNLLKSLGGKPVNIYTTPDIWMWILPFMYTWKWVGFGSVLYLAAIMGIDQEIYEAARIDGAGILQRVRYVTLPSLKPTMIILILIGIGKIMRGEFDMFYNLIGNNGILIDKTDIIDTLVFRSILGTQDFGMASAAGLYQSILCFLIIVTVNSIVKKINPDYALF